MKITINDDLTIVIVNTEGLVARIANHNPVTLQRFQSKQEAQEFAESVQYNPAYFQKSTNTPVNESGIPLAVAMWQARMILIQEGLMDGVLAALDGISDPIKRAQALAKFEYSPTVRRDDPLLDIIIPALGRSKEQIDAMFLAASKL